MNIRKRFKNTKKIPKYVFNSTRMFVFENNFLFLQFGEVKLLSKLKIKVGKINFSTKFIDYF